MWGGDVKKRRAGRGEQEDAWKRKERKGKARTTKPFHSLVFPQCVGQTDRKIPVVEGKWVQLERNKGRVTV